MINSLILCMMLSLSCAFYRSFKPHTHVSFLFTCFGSSSGSNDGAHQRLERIISNRGTARDHHLLTYSLTYSLTRLLTYLHIYVPTLAIAFVHLLTTYFLGIGSRLEVSKLFRQGRVTINGKVILSGKNKYPLGMPLTHPFICILTHSLVYSIT